MKKQKNVLISYFLFYGGFLLSILSICVVLIYSLLFGNTKGDIIHIISFIVLIIGIILPYFASDFNLYFYFSSHKPEYFLHKCLRVNDDRGFIQGVPNNNYKEFLCPGITNCTSLELYNCDGIFTGKHNNQSIRIDMRGWILKNKYVYELFQTYYIINYLKEHKIPLKNISKKINNKNINEFNLVIYKGKKKKTFRLSSNGTIDSRLFLKIKNKKKYKFIENNEYSIFDFYNLNKC